MILLVYSYDNYENYSDGINAIKNRWITNERIRYMINGLIVGNIGI